MDYGSGADTLRTIADDGTVPSCRMTSARATQDWLRRLVDNDVKRAFKRSKVNGLVDGNPPYRASKLREAGRAESCNVNWGTGRSTLESGSGSFYDLSSEAPGIITFRTAFGNDEQKELWSDLAATEADKTIRNDKVWDYQMQISQGDMVLHGCGPFVFEDGMTVFPRAVLCGDLKVPEMTKSDTYYFEACAVQVKYYPAELYKFIKDGAAAKQVGWNVEYTKRVIANASDIQLQPAQRYDWEFFQQQFKNNSFNYYDDTKVCYVAHCFWQEFDGRITHAIVQNDTTVGSAWGVKENDESKKDCQYLFLCVGRYANWTEALHPMYYDHGNGGYHHSVTGLGTKMYSAMESENRLICNLFDGAFAPKILFKPTTGAARDKFSMMRMSNYGVIPAGYDWTQSGLNGQLQDGMEMWGQLQGIFQRTLSNYKQGVTSQKSGNPVTKFEKQMEAAMQSALSMPQFNRYYKQLDYLYAEIWRRLSNPNSTDERAKKFQAKCKELGIPAKALLMIDYVGATRVIGQGSAFMRKQSVDALMPMAGSLPEDGRNRLLNDKISAEAGQSAVVRYNPPQKQKPLASDQQIEALHWVADMKTGLPFTVASSQNPVTFAATFMSAGVQAVNALQKGADPHETLAFLELIGPAIATCLSRFGQDPTRQPVHQKLMEQWKQLAKMTDKLKQAMQQQAEQQNAQKQKTQQAMSDQQISQAKARNDISIKNAKTRAQLQQSSEKHQNALALKTASTLADIKLKDASTASQIHLSRLKSLQEADA